MLFHSGGEFLLFCLFFLIVRILAAANYFHTFLFYLAYGFSWRTEGDTIHVLDSDGKLAIRLGDAVKMGGMDINLENLRSFVNTLAAPPIPEDYSGPIFVVCGSIINDTLDLEKARERLNLPDK
mgnify:CR=1 FL=1